jgi:hypothetical protein
MNWEKYRCEMDTFYPNKSYDWMPNDTREFFYSNIKNYPDNTTLNYYLNNPISYNLNNFGFRTPDDFELNEWGNVYLGCSHTLGVGHHLENVWSYKLNQYVGGKFWNLGVGGTGVMTHFRLLKQFSKKFKIKNIFHYAPKYYPRYEFLINNIPTTFRLSTTYSQSELVKNVKQFGNLYESSLTNLDQIDMMYDTHIFACKGFAEEIGCNYYIVNDERTRLNGKPNDDEFLGARDLHHYNVNVQQSICDDFIKMIG